MPVTDITLDIVTFKSLFPEFSLKDDTLLTNQLNLACISTNEYKGVKSRCGQNEQYLAIYLYLAHQMKITGLLDADPAATGDCIGGIKKKVKSKNDEIEFDTSTMTEIDFGSTRYGIQLRDILTRCSFGAGAMKCGSCCAPNAGSTYVYIQESK